MYDDLARPGVVRRSFLNRLGASAALIGAGVSTSAALEARAPQAGTWRPARHEHDAWLGQIPGKHRLFLDTLTPKGAGQALGFAFNYADASKTGYGLEDADLATVICLRHFATPFAFTDAIWAKYSEAIAAEIDFMDPKTGKAPVINLFVAEGYGHDLPNEGQTLQSAIARGVHFAVCDLATHYFAGQIATKAGGQPADIYNELIASAVANSHFVPAGIVAVNRAQEYGYAFGYVG